MDHNEQLLSDNKEPKTNIFLLTKPPCSDRARFCLRLIAQSKMPSFIWPEMEFITCSKKPPEPCRFIGFWPAERT